MINLTGLSDLTSASPTPQRTDPGALHEVVIVGSGPAGYTAAIYAARTNLAPVVVAGDVKSVTTGEGATYRARSVILANGSAYRELGLDNESQLTGRGVSYCATCDGFFFREQHIVVVGGGDSAMEEATFLTKFAAKVTARRQGILSACGSVCPRGSTESQRQTSGTRDVTRSVVSPWTRI